ncbi:MAG: tetratricopeptide repeat protein [Elusimicrobiota bacterium]
MLALLTLLAGLALADDADDGWKAFKAGKFDEAIRLSMPSALKGDDGSQYTVAAALEEKDPAKAVPWYEKSAKGGNGYAMYRLGWLYETGRGVKKDLASAAFWYEQCAPLGETRCTKSIAFAYVHGTGVKADPAKAFKWMKLSAEDGTSPQSAYSLGLMYGKAHGTKRDMVESYRWMWVGAKGGHKESKDFVALLDREMSAVDVEKAKRRARDFEERRKRAQAAP